jgi:hypothetical protein
MAAWLSGTISAPIALVRVVVTLDGPQEVAAVLAPAVENRV